MTSPKTIKFVLPSLLLMTLVYGQDSAAIDSLKSLTPNHIQDDSLYVAHLSTIFREYSYFNLDSAKKYSEKIIDFSKERDYTHGQYRGHLLDARYHWFKSDYKSAIEAMNKALENALQLKDYGLVSACYVRLAMAHSNLSDYGKAKQLTLQALQNAKKSDDWNALSYAYSRLGNVYYFENNLDSALIQYLKVDSIFSSNNEIETSLGGALSNIGGIYMEINDSIRAIEYYNKSKSVYQQLDDLEGVQHINVRLAELSEKMQNHQAVIKYLREPLEFYSRNGNKKELTNIYNLLGYSHYQFGDLNLAKEYFDNSIKLAIEIEDNFTYAKALVGQAEIDHVKGRYRSSLLNFEKAYKLCDSLGITHNKSGILRQMALIYTKQGDVQNASKYYEQYIDLNDSLVKIRAQENVRTLETKYQTEKKEQEIELLKSENALAEQQKRNQRNILLGGIGITSVAGIFLFLLYRNRQKTNRRLTELDAAKSNFFANISHEFRTPLTLIQGPIQQKLEEKSLSKKDRTDLEMIDRNNQRLLELVDQILDLSKIDAGSLRLNLSKGYPLTLIRAWADSFSYSAQERKIKYTVHIDPNDQNELWFDKDALEKITLNLLSNAIKYTPDAGTIICSATIENKKFLLEVKNSGHMFNELEAKRVFDRFHQSDDNNPGVGIGLALVKELVHLHKGSIYVTQMPEQMVSFSVELDMDKSNFPKTSIKEGMTSVQKRVTTSLETPKIDIDHIDDESDLPILLIVEDNNDMQKLLTNVFENHYQLLLAENGEVGKKMAVEHIPDLIISDVMMPIMDGIRMTEILKTDERTSHIPIILLTAKAGDENKLVGIETGADDYITKPFNQKILVSKTAKLIALRKELQSRYSQEVILKPKDIALNSVDEQFLEKVQKVMDEQLVEPSFNIESFSQAVGMSRMQLHRKLKALTGLSASDFIRSQRIKLAADLLKNSDSNVSQIGYAVGFNNHSYFTRCFKEVYGQTPSEFAKKSS